MHLVCLSFQRRIHWAGSWRIGNGQSRIDFCFIPYSFCFPKQCVTRATNRMGKCPKYHLPTSWKSCKRRHTGVKQWWPQILSYSTSNAVQATYVTCQKETDPIPTLQSLKRKAISIQLVLEGDQIARVIASICSTSFLKKDPNLPGHCILSQKLPSNSNMAFWLL